MSNFVNIDKISHEKIRKSFKKAIYVLRKKTRELIYRALEM